MGPIPMLSKSFQTDYLRALKMETDSFAETFQPGRIGIT
jgi:hypothetical protein